MENYPTTCVSGYWKIGNKHGNKFENWFNKTLKINCPYVFFGNKDTIEMVKKYRGNLPTHYIELNIEDFVTYKYKDRMVTHPRHCPSVELNLVWNEKIFMIYKAFQINPFSSEYFCWVDAGICIFRNNPPPNKPFPDITKLQKLPKDKFIFSSCTDYNPNDSRYYYKMSYITGTYILHKNIILMFTALYKIYSDILIDKNNIWTDQVILTHIYRDRKNLFYKMCHGYGRIILDLY